MYCRLSLVLLDLEQAKFHCLMLESQDSTIDQFNLGLYRYSEK